VPGACSSSSSSSGGSSSGGGSIKTDELFYTGLKEAADAATGMARSLDLIGSYRLHARSVLTRSRRQQRAKDEKWQQLQTTCIEALGELEQQLGMAGGALCVSALPPCCNNPGCSNLGSVSEAFGLMRGKGCVCGGCSRAAASSGGVEGAEEATAAGR
jgi:hypothetical protein